ncbi:MAG TPA: EVE domain-containing protein [Longimicrobiales bacterium]|nr:EVE domain-containing protein [Longimicrobiales bacterium]
MNVDPQRWALLADPEDYGWKELLRDGRAVWDGIKNARAQQNLKQCRVGDVALIYHTAPDKAIMGTARVTKAAYPDPKAADRVVIEVEPVVALKRPLTMAELRSDNVLSEMGFVRMPRVAVQPVTPAQWERVMALTKTDLGASLSSDPNLVGGP